MRILYLAPDPVPSPKGASVRILRTVEALRGLGHDVALLTPAGREPPGPSHDTIALEDGNFLRRAMTLRRAATRWLEDRRADLVQFRSIWEGVPAVAWARRTGGWAVLEAHGFASVELPYHYPGLQRHPRVLERIIAEERAVLAGCNRVVTPSRTGARFLLRLGVRPERIAVVPNAVDVELFSPAPVPPPDAPPYRVVYEGTLSPWQGLASLLEAMALLRHRGGIELHVVGPTKSAWRAAIRRRARRLRVHHDLHLSGPMAQADLVPVLRTAHVCVAPLPADSRNALQGCCPLKLLEYMAAGRPILSTSIAPVEEILEHGRTAYLVEPGSAAALAGGLRHLLDRPAEREALGAAARAEAEKHWTEAPFRERLAALLAGLAEPGEGIVPAARGVL